MSATREVDPRPVIGNVSPSDLVGGQPFLARPIRAQPVAASCADRLALRAFPSVCSPHPPPTSPGAGRGHARRRTQATGPPSSRSAAGKARWRSQRAPRRGWQRRPRPGAGRILRAARADDHLAGRLPRGPRAGQAERGGGPLPVGRVLAMRFRNVCFMLGCPSRSRGSPCPRRSSSGSPAPWSPT